MLFGRHINKYYLKYSLYFLSGIIALLFVDYFQLKVPEVIGNVIDGLKEQSLTKDILFTSIISIMISAVIMVTGRFLWRLFIFGASRRIEFDLRNKMFDHAEKLSDDYYSKNKTGALMALFTNDLQTVRMAVGPGVIMLVDVLFLGSLAFYKMLKLDVKLTLISAIPVLIIAGFGGVIGKFMRKRFKARQKAFANLSDFSQENFSGISVIKAFVNEQKEIREFAKINQDNLDKNIDAVKVLTVLQIFVGFIVSSIVIVIIWYGGYLVYSTQGLPQDDRFTVGQLSEYMQYFNALLWPMMAIAGIINIRSQGKASLQRIDSLLGQDIDVKDSDSVLDIDSIDGSIRFDDLTFSYPDNNEPVLKNISFSIKQGQTIGIIGRTGCGKTTLVDLLLRLYNIERGKIFVDDNDIVDIPIKTLRNEIGYIPQDNFLFSDTIISNIAFVKENDQELTDEVIEAASDSDVHSNIIDFPKQYNTIIGERGVTLSGGQKQRISIARALLKDPKILILDDSVSAVDTNTEEKILSNLKRIRNNKTTIFITHRITTIKEADSIILMDDGKITAYGTHDDLVNSSAEYKDIVDRQKLEDEVEGGR